MRRSSLAEEFLAAAGAGTAGGGGGVEHAALERALAGVVAEAQREWPRIRIEPIVFVRYVAQRMPETKDPLRALASTHGRDLYVACGCAQADARAIAELDARFLVDVSAYVARLEASPEFAEELKQHLREHLLTSRGGPPRIASYSGQGPLGAWLRMIAIRAAWRLLKGRGRDVVLDTERSGRLRAPVADPEIAYLKRHCRAEFKAALVATLEGLSTDERNVLRLHFVEAMTVDAIGAIYGVHSMTIRRWIAKATQKLAKETRRRLAMRLSLRVDELPSVMALVESGLEVSIRRYLART